MNEGRVFLGGRVFQGASFPGDKGAGGGGARGRGACFPNYQKVSRQKIDKNDRSNVSASQS